jgi:two-component system response regulator
MMDVNNSPIDILVVEDNPNDATLMLRALRKNHVSNNIKVCEDGEEALEYLFSKGQYEGISEPSTIKVVFLDLKLPKINGLEVLKEIRENELTHKMPVVVVTSSKEDPDIKAAYELGVNSYVVKPVQFEDFVQAVAQIGMYWLLLNEPPK